MGVLGTVTLVVMIALLLGVVFWFCLKGPPPP